MQKQGSVEAKASKVILMHIYQRPFVNTLTHTHEANFQLTSFFGGARDRGATNSITSSCICQNLDRVVGIRIKAVKDRAQGMSDSRFR